MKPEEGRGRTASGSGGRDRSESAFVPSHPLFAKILQCCGGGQSQAFVGVIMVLLSTLGFSFCALFIALLSRDGVPSFQGTTSRFLGQAICSVLAVIFVKRKSPSDLRSLSTWIGKPENRWLLFNRAFWGGLAMSSYFFALGIPGARFSDVVVLVFLNVPLTTILAFFLLKEPFTWVDGLTTSLCFVGVILVVQPESLFGASSNPSGETPQPVPLLVIAVSLFAAITSAIAYLSIKRIGKKESSLTLTLCFSLVGCFIGPIGLFLTGQTWVVPSGPNAAADNWMLVGVGIAGFLGQVLLNRGMVLAPSGPSAAMRYADLLFSMIFQSTVFHNPPNALKLVGIALVLSVIVSIIDRQRRLSNAKKKAKEALGFSPTAPLPSLSAEALGSAGEWDKGDKTDASPSSSFASFPSPSQPGSDDRRSLIGAEHDEALQQARFQRAFLSLQRQEHQTLTEEGIVLEADA